MVRMSDILKKAQERKLKAEEETGGSTESPQEQPQPVDSEPHPLQERVVSPEPSSGISKEGPEVEKRIEDQPRSEIRISPSLMAGSKLLNEEESMGLYEEAFSVVKSVYDKAKMAEEIITEDKDIINCVEKFVNQQSLGNENILNLITLPVQNGTYLYCHVINLCIIAIDLGLGLGYDRTKLLELGTAAILHDIGMMKFYDLYTQPRELNAEEYNEIKKHPKTGAELIEKYRNIYKKTVSVVYQTHERINGTGYPHGLKGNAIEEYAKIIGTADVYDALTHPRPYRDKFSPYEALKEILNSQDLFEKRILKVLVERIATPYPLGSYVKLSSGEKGKVVKRNLMCPLRPVIEIIYDVNGEMIEKPKRLDLAGNPIIYIKGPRPEEEIEKEI